MLERDLAKSARIVKDAARGPDATPTVIHHFGPDIDSVGGMATVIRVLTENCIGGDRVECHPTWTPRSRAATVRFFGKSVATVRRIPTTQVAHVHLSEGGSFIREGALLALARRRGLGTVATIHGASFIPFAKRFPRLASTVLERAHKVICLDHEVLYWLHRTSPLVAASIVPNPVVIPNLWSPADQTAELVVFGGAIGLRKGADVLCRAWETIFRTRPDAKCVLIGPTVDFLPGRIDGLEVKPQVSGSEMQDWLRRARVVVLPSREEGMPMVLTEAMSHARPIVATPVGAVPELARAGGILVPVGDSVSLAEGVASLLSTPSLARAIGEHGRRFCADTRSVSVVDRRLRVVYADVRRRRDGSNG